MAYCRLMDDDQPGEHCDFCGAPLQRECLDAFYWTCDAQDCTALNEDSWWTDPEEDFEADLEEEALETPTDNALDDFDNEEELWNEAESDVDDLLEREWGLTDDAV